MNVAWHCAIVKSRQNEHVPDNTLANHLGMANVSKPLVARIFENEVHKSRQIALCVGMHGEGVGGGGTAG